MGRALSYKHCALVYAVDDEHRSAAILAVAGQMAKAGLGADSSESYLFDDFKNDLIEHGAILVVKACTFRRYPWAFNRATRLERSRETGTVRNL